MSILSNIVAALTAPRIDLGTIDLGEANRNMTKTGTILNDKMTVDLTDLHGKNTANSAKFDGGLGFDTLTLKLTETQHAAMKAEISAKMGVIFDNGIDLGEAITLFKVFSGQQYVKLDCLDIELKGWECIKFDVVKDPLPLYNDEYGRGNFSGLDHSIDLNLTTNSLQLEDGTQSWTVTKAEEATYFTGGDEVVGFNFKPWQYIGSNYSDRMIGNDGGQAFSGEGGNDYLYGNGGNDELRGETGDDYLDGGDGNDWLIGGEGRDDIMGGNGDDTIAAGNGGGTIYGNDGNDTIYAGDGSSSNDFILGGNGDDTIIGGTGFSHLRGEAGDDVIKGGTGHDIIVGGTGKDTLYAGDDQVSDIILFKATSLGAGGPADGPAVDEVYQFNVDHDQFQIDVTMPGFHTLSITEDGANGYNVTATDTMMGGSVSFHVNPVAGSGPLTTGDFLIV